jgi:hypothetical protein
MEPPATLSSAARGRPRRYAFADRVHASRFGYSAEANWANCDVISKPLQHALQHQSDQNLIFNYQNTLTRSTDHGRPPVPSHDALNIARRALQKLNDQRSEGVIIESVA